MKATFSVLNPAECDKTQCECDLCGILQKFQFIRLTDIMGKDFNGEYRDREVVNICHDCFEKMQTALEHELRSK